MQIKYSEDFKHAYFNNIEFYKCGDYYKNHKEGRLHVYIYKFHNGAVPKGYHIHHKDENKFNNEISNLQLLKNSEHNRLHALENKLGQYERTAKHKENLSKIIKNRPQELKEKFSKSRLGKAPYNKGTKLTNEVTRQKMQEAQKGNKHKSWIEITIEMIADYNNGIRRKDFIIKYSVSRSIWAKLVKIMKEVV